MLLYEMLIGQSPFSGCDEDELFWSICNEIPWYPHFLSKESLKILQSLLEKDVSIRLGSMGAPDGDIKYHPFFAEISWEKLERTGTAVQTASCEYFLMNFIKLAEQSKLS